MERINLGPILSLRNIVEDSSFLVVEEVALWWRYERAREIMSLVGRLRPGATKARHTVRALRLFNRARSEYVAIVKKIKRLVGKKI